MDLEVKETPTDHNGTRKLRSKNEIFDLFRINAISINQNNV